MYGSSLLIDEQTPVVPAKKTLEMQEMLYHWLKEVGAGIPIVSATGREVDLPGRRIQHLAPEQ